MAKIHDGCTVEFEGGFTVHLTGISVPDPRSRVGWVAFDFTKRRLEGRVVRVFTWSTDNTATGIVRGRYGLAFAKIEYGEGLSTDIAAQLLERGYARVDPNHLPEGFEIYVEIERQAKDQKLGIWATTD